MINQLLHVQPTALDSVEHRQVRLQWPVNDWTVARRLGSVFLAAVEFRDACREYPIVFVRAGDGPDGKPLIAPVAVLALQGERNLFLDGKTWRANYLPALLGTYPFCAGRVNEERFAICIDAAWSGLSQTEGQPLFTADGQQTELLTGMTKQLELLEAEIARTQVVAQRFMEMGLLQDMRFDATLPDGSKVGVDGFLSVDEKRFNELTAAEVFELHSNGLLGLLHAHMISLANMRRLADWHSQAPAASAA